MRVVLVTDLFFPGANGVCTAIRSLAETLREAGHSVALIGPSSIEAKEWCARQGVECWSAASVQLPAKIGQRIGIFPPSSRSILAALRGADVVHLHSPFLIGFSVARAAKKQRIPIVVTNHALPENLTSAFRIPLEVADRIFANLVWKWIRKGHRLADVITSPSRYGAELIERKVGDVSVRVVSNGVRCPAKKQSIAILPGQPMRALYVGRLQREKRVDELIYAAHACRRSGLNVELTIVGDGPDRQRLERLAETLNLGRHVSFAGFVSDSVRDQHYKAAHCFWIASRAELQCCAALEAMAAGCPVIASRAGALTETVPDRIAGYLYSPGNLDHFVQIVRAMTDEPALHAHLSLGAFSEARKHRLPFVRSKTIDLYNYAIQEVRQGSLGNAWESAHA